MKILIAVTGPHNERTRAVVKILLDELALMHINMKQPLIDFAAECMNVDVHHLEHHVPLHHVIPELRETVGEVQARIKRVLCAEDKDYFVKFAEKQINKNKSLAIANIFNGNIVSNICTESEAEWARKNKAFFIHVRDSDATTPEDIIKHHQQDRVILTSRKWPRDGENLDWILRAIWNHFGIKKAA
jgi:hypothetical protein